METVVEEIERALATLQLPSEAMRLLPSGQGKAAYRRALDHFVSSGDRLWWWEDFSMPAAAVVFEAGDAWEHILGIVPDTQELIWFIAEEEQLPHYPVFETTPQVASAIIAECYFFEYYLVARDLSWLLCENHHNVVYGVGSAVESKLLRVAGQHTGRVL